MRARIEEVRARWVPTVIVSVLGLLVALPATAEAAVSGNAVPDFPTAVTVGDTGLPASITLTNQNTGAEASLTNIVCNFNDPGPCTNDPGIILKPSCGTLASGDCSMPELGIFAVSTTATGAAGSACAGMVFDVATIAGGALRFTPQSGAHVVLSGAPTSCKINFAVDALKTPVIDNDPGTPGDQTLQVAQNTQVSGASPSIGRGVDVTTISPAPPHTVTVSLTGTGTGTVTGLGINCPGDCAETYANGATVQNVSLTATPSGGSSFDGFSGACSGQVCTVSTSADRTVDAAFSPPPPPPPPPDTTPPETTITKGAPNKTDKNKITFRFEADVPDATFACQLKGKGLDPAVKQFSACSSPRKYKNLDPHKYKFLVVATDPAGNTDLTPATYKFKVVD